MLSFHLLRVVFNPQVRHGNLAVNNSQPVSLGDLFKGFRRTSFFVESCEVAIEILALVRSRELLAGDVPRLIGCASLRLDRGGTDPHRVLLRVASEIRNRWLDRQTRVPIFGQAVNRAWSGPTDRDAFVPYTRSRFFG